MTEVHHLSRQDARRIAVRAQLLDRERPTDLVELVRHLTLLQLDPTSAVAPSADLVAWSRLGAAYSPEDLRDLLDRQELLEHRGTARDPAYLRLLRAEMSAWPGEEPLTDWQQELRDWVLANDECRRDVLDRLRGDGPLPQSELPDTCVLPWRSSGWSNGKNLGRMLDFMVQRGEIAVAGREGRERLWDLAERVHPEDPDGRMIPEPEARRARAELLVRSLGLCRPRQPQASDEPSAAVDGVGEAAVIDGVRGRWRVDPEQLEHLDGSFEGRTVLLSPLDRLVFDRKRMTEIFEFDYQLEMYKPAAKRRWGYWAMPVLAGDRLVGKLDATADREAGVLLVNAVHEDDPFPSEVREAVQHEIAALADWLGLEPVTAGSSDA